MDTQPLESVVIMTDPIIALARLDSKALHNRLMETMPTVAMREGMKTAVLEYNKQLKAEKLSKHHHKTLWRVILRDLKYEHNNTIVGAKYHSRNPKPERDLAFTEYLKVMDKLRNLIEYNYAMTGITPTKLAKEKQVPNNGEHWTDWVPEHVKEKITTKFDGIPHMPKTKRKLPFQRAARPIRNGTAKTKREVLIGTVHLELEHLVRAKAVADTEAVRYKQHQLRRVLDWLDNATDSTAMPRTWHGVLKLIENGSD